MLNDTQLNHILEDFDIAYWQIDPITKDIFWSEHFHNLIGKPDINTNKLDYFLKEVLHEDNRYDFISAFDNIGVIALNIELRLKLEGKYRWFECRSLKNKTEGNNEKGNAVLLFVNIHQSKRDQYTIEENFFYYRETAEMTSTGGWYVDLRNEAVYWDNVTKKIMQCPLDYEPVFAERMKFFAPEEREKLNSALKKCIEFGIPYVEEMKMISLHGKEIWVRCSAKPVYNNEQEIVAVRGVIQDINETKTTEINLQHCLNIIAQQNSRLFNFAHIISHNLRSHSSNLSLVSQLLTESKTNKDKLSLMSNVEDISESIETSIVKLNEIVSAPDTVILERKPVKFQTAFERVLTSISSLVRRENAKIETDFHQLEEIEYISDYLESILLNLISNSILYKYEGRRPVILITTYKKADESYLEISDNGKGIDLDQHGNALFGMYKTFHFPNGKGVGLFITKSQVESLGGRISVSSTVDIGTTFKIKF